MPYDMSEANGGDMGGSTTRRCVAFRVTPRFPEMPVRERKGEDIRVRLMNLCAERLRQLMFVRRRSR